MWHAAAALTALTAVATIAAAAPPPPACAASNASDPFLFHAVAAFEANNGECLDRFTACIITNGSACVLDCDAGASSLRSACSDDAGATLCGVDGRQARPGGGLPEFLFHTLACVPAACGPALHDAYELWWRQRLCATLVNESACAALALTCGYAAPDGQLWSVALWTSIVGAIVFGACGLGYCYTRRKQLEEEEAEAEAASGGVYLGELGDDAELVAYPAAASASLPPGAHPESAEHDDPTATLIVDDVDPTAAYTWAQRPQDPAHR